MKIPKLFCMCVVGMLLAGVSHAHIYGGLAPFDTSFGYSIYKYKWHADSPYSSAIIQSAKTNLGLWERYPGPSATREAVEGFVGPVETGKWYRAKFYGAFVLFPKTLKPVYAVADVCGITPWRSDK